MTAEASAPTPESITYLAGATSITDDAEIREILRSSAFRQAGHSISARHFIADTVVLLDGPSHRERRRIESKLFTDAVLSRFRDEALVPSIESVLDELAPTADDDGVVRADLVPLAWRLLQEVPIRVVGIDGIVDDASAARFSDLLQRFAAALTLEYATGDQEEILAEGMAIRDDLVETFVRPSAERRRRLVGDDDAPIDLMTLLYQHWNADWDDDLAIREALIYLVASVLTTTHSLPFLMLHLERWFEHHPEHRALTTTDPGFLVRAAAEALRFYVASPARTRIANEDVTLRSSGRLVRAGERVALFFIPANERAEAFQPNGDRFDPFRRTTVAPWGLAFGSGSHMCPGKPMVVGAGPRGSDSGTAATIASALYRAGFELDAARPLVSDTSTLYLSYASVPIQLTSLAGRLSQRGDRP